MKTENLLKVKDTPSDIAKHKYLFDMGYPYYLSMRHSKVAFTCDLGILTYEIWMFLF